MGMNMKKWIVLGGALVVGLVILSASFQGGGTSAVPVSEPVPIESIPPSPTKSPKPVEPVDATGAAIGLYNGTAEPGLADKIARKMGVDYNVVQIGNTLDQQTVTAVYYVKAKDQPAAEAVALAEFQDSDVTEFPKGTQVSVDGTTQKVSPGDIQVVVFLGDDQL